MENIKENKKQGFFKLKESEKMVIYFFIYAFLGWCIETLYAICVTGHFIKRGFLYGPLCPMYGYAAVMMIYILKKVKTNTIGKFLICTTFFTIFEYLVALVLESIFGLKWWDYSSKMLNFQGRICLSFSIVWGVLGVAFVDLLHPYINKKLEKYCNKIPSHIILGTAYTFIAMNVIDTILSIIKYVNI